MIRRTEDQEEDRNWKQEVSLCDLFGSVVLDRSLLLGYNNVHTRRHETRAPNQTRDKASETKKSDDLVRELARLVTLAAKFALLGPAACMAGFLTLNAPEGIFRVSYMLITPNTTERDEI